MLAVSLDNISISYGSNIVLKDINIGIEEGEFVSIVGPNGGGKSTLLKLLLGLLIPNSGKAEILGQDTGSIPAGVIGYVPQIKTLDRYFPANPIELVASGINGNWSGRIKKEQKSLALEALEQVGVAHLANRSLNKLSGGEMQKVYLARSFARKPRLLFLDEPITGIDSVSEKDISKLIDEYYHSAKITVVMVTHDWEAAYHHSTRVLLLNKSVICYAPPEQAFEDSYLRKTFGHIGHTHEMIFGAKRHD
ncbi:MAG: metal ABC transporter ATP-binding protein [Ignavibacteria bacterium]|nr:metal ABC transporter ATP-binding protein [Ignavibacteria bacterium]